MYYSHVKCKLLLCLCLLGLSAAAQSTVSPDKVAAEIKNNSAPPIIYVGFPVLYKGAHLPQAVFAGPCSKPEGLDLLTQAVKTISHDAEIIIYCGCCPFTRCPNVRPAFAALKAAGFTNVKILQLDTNLHTDWVEKGYPVEKQ